MKPHSVCCLGSQEGYSPRNLTAMSDAGLGAWLDKTSGEIIHNQRIYLILLYHRETQKLKSIL